MSDSLFIDPIDPKKYSTYEEYLEALKLHKEFEDKSVEVMVPWQRAILRTIGSKIWRLLVLMIMRMNFVKETGVKKNCLKS
ncbi:MAG: hypothetical protein WC897_00145 [Candidatus Gracilibacteria bacterium]